MAELLDTVASWPSLLLVLLVFGFAPGFCLRLIVLAYPRDDPRRKELIAELYAVPRIQRPLWVAEQLEVALFEGLTHRISAVIHRLTGRRRTREQAAQTAQSWATTFSARLIELVSVGTATRALLPEVSLWVVVLTSGAATFALLALVACAGRLGRARRVERRSDSRE